MFSVLLTCYSVVLVCILSEPLHTITAQIQDSGEYSGNFGGNSCDSRAASNDSNQGKNLKDGDCWFFLRRTAVAIHVDTSVGLSCIYRVVGQVFVAICRSSMPAKFVAALDCC